MTRCFLVAVSTPNQESAFRVFSVMNSRGLDLLPTDIIKSMTIGKLQKDEEQAYTEKWEELENMTGRDGFNEVFTHTRTIFAKERPKKNLLDEFKEYVVNATSPKELIDDYLEPYTEAYVRLKNCEFSSTKNAEEINELLYWLNKTNNYDWMPPAIKFLVDQKNDSDYILSYTLTTQVINVDEWTPRIVESRQKYLEDVFTNKWDIKISKDDSIEDPVYKLAGRGGSATGYLTTEVEFVVMKGSRVASNVTDGFQAGYMNLRNQLITDGVIVDNVFVNDYTFTSMSAAAAVILGRSANGRKEWTKLDGRTFAQVGH